MNTTPPAFTAAELARVLGLTSRAMLLRLRECPASGSKKVRGQNANAWCMAALPSTIREELAALTHERGLENVSRLFDDPPAPWQPARPWHEIPPAFQQRAEQLAAALAPALVRQHELPGPELMDLAAVRYRQHFGHALETEKLRYLMDRATIRDHGFKQFHRPDLYLDDAAFNAAPGAPLALPEIHRPMEEHVSKIENRSEPGLKDRAFLFHAAFQHLELMAQSHPSKGERRAAKASLVEYLYRHVPGLYRPQAAGEQNKPLLSLRRFFNLAYAQWSAGGRTVESIMDQRAGKCGRKGYRHEECEKKITAHAARLRGPRGVEGNVDLAIKWLSEQNHICALCQHHFSPVRLSPAARTRLTPNSLQVALFKGADAVRKIAPTHHCDRSDRQAGDRFVIDDMTPNELTWDEVDGEIVSGQCQKLATEDEISRYPLPFLLYIGAPNSHTITKAISLVLTHVGLPHEALLTERGVFANRRTAGERGIQHRLDFRALQAAMEKYFQFEALPDEVLAEIRKCDLGLRDPAFRLNITQARNPQGKSIERSFYEFQKSASRLPGFAGFNQRNEKPRAMQDFDRRVKIGKEHPGNEYLHLSELRKNYELICAEIAARPINGQTHRGRSPAQVWQEAVSRNPLRKLPPEIEALFSTHRLPSIKVGSQGIRVRLNQFDTAFYFGEATGPLVDRQVAVRINYDIPEYIHLEHPDTGKLMKVNRQWTKSKTATVAELAEVKRARRAHVNGALGEIGNVKNLFTVHVLRNSMHSPADREAGAQIAADAIQHKTEQAATAREQKQLERLAGALGTAVPSQPRNQARQREGLEMEQEALAEIAAMQNAAQPEGNKP